MHGGCEDIKLFYENILERDSICENTNVPITRFGDYILSVYEAVENKKFSKYKQPAADVLELSQYKLKELIIEAIYSNLYCDILLMLQNINANKYGVSHEKFLTSVECNDKLGLEISRACKERFRRRMQFKRLSLIDTVAIKLDRSRMGIDSPTLIRFFKETLLIKRPGTEILDISKNYAEIFFSLMFDTDEENSLYELRKSRELIKAYRMWKLTNENTKFILNMYETVLNGPLQGDRHAQLMLLEKLFGIYTISDLLLNKKGRATILETLSQIGGLGYCFLHKHLVEKISGTNYKQIRRIIYRYIQPLCSDVMAEIVKTIVGFLDETDTESAAEFLIYALSVCKKNICTNFTNDPIEYIKGCNCDDVTVDIKTITRFRDITDFFDLGVYLKENFEPVLSTRFYEESYAEGLMSPIGFFFEKSCIDLTYSIRKPLTNKASRELYFDRIYTFE